MASQSLIRESIAQSKPFSHHLRQTQLPKPKQGTDRFLCATQAP